MLRIECPWCGVRDEPEFRFGGESGVVRPEAGCTDRAWIDYLYFRTNVRGLQHERWLHAHGCARWFNLIRDTVSHRIVAAYRIGESPPCTRLEPGP
jgi:heterotetrameric sarcosine oxidase delta subunit